MSSYPQGVVKSHGPIDLERRHYTVNVTVPVSEMSTENGQTFVYSLKLDDFYVTDAQGNTTATPEYCFLRGSMSITPTATDFFGFISFASVGEDMVTPTTANAHGTRSLVNSSGGTSGLGNPHQETSSLLGHSVVDGSAYLNYVVGGMPSGAAPSITLYGEVTLTYYIHDPNTDSLLDNFRSIVANDTVTIAKGLYNDPDTSLSLVAPTISGTTTLLGANELYGILVNTTASDQYNVTTDDHEIPMNSSNDGYQAFMRVFGKPNTVRGDGPNLNTRLQAADRNGRLVLLYNEGTERINFAEPSVSRVYQNGEPDGFTLDVGASVLLFWYQNRWNVLAAGAS